MKVTLINVSARMSSDGSRLICALLKQADHSVKSVFLARPEPLSYEQEELAQLDDILKNTDLVMIAVYSSYAIRAVQVTEFIRKNYPGMKVIWGGPHCISIPKLSLRYADAVCFSEGDRVVVDLVNKIEDGNNYLDTPNMAFNVDGSYIVNDVLPPFRELDSLPYHDYNLEDQFLLDRKLFQITKEVFRKHLAGYYPFYTIPILYFVTSRGCPHRCSFCNNCRYIAMFGRNELRFQSADRIIDELEYILNYLGFIEFLGFADDDFFIRTLKDLDDFAEKYKRRVGLPFGVGVSPNTFSKVDRPSTLIFFSISLLITLTKKRMTSFRLINFCWIFHPV